MIDVVRHVIKGEYDIIHELGRGGMAAVYLSHDIALDRRVAIKVMLPQLALSGSEVVQRFQREARTAASLSHPHIIPVYAVNDDKKLPYFVMKYVSGRPLDSVLADEGRLPLGVVQTILSQVGMALDYAHRHGVVHRDIKPANIMLDEEGWAVVTDFGIAKAITAQALTLTGAAVGTPTYMSPEQATADEVTGASDQYSLGVVAYEMLTGSPPFEGTSAITIMVRHTQEAPPPLLDRWPDCPPGIAETVMRMLAKSPGDRFPSVAEAIEALGTGDPEDSGVRTRIIDISKGGRNKELLDQFQTPKSPFPIRTGVRSSVRSKAQTGVGAKSGPASKRLVPIVASGVILIGALGWWLGSRGSAPPGMESRVAGPAAAASVALDPAPVEPVATPPPAMNVPAPTAAVAPTPTPAVRPASARVATSIEATPPAVTIEQGHSVSLVATVLDAAGRPLAGELVRWIGEPGYLVTVTSEGVVTGLQPGQALAIARSGGVETRVAVTVVPPAVGSVRLQPPAASLLVGESVRMTAQAVSATGVVLSDRSAGWTVAGSAVSVTGDGTIVGRQVGSAVVTVTMGGVSAEAQVTVAQPAARESVAPVPPPVPVRDEVADRRAIAGVIAAYSAAIEAEDLNALRVQYPGITTRQANAWRDFFGTASNIRFAATLTSTTVAGDLATIRVDVTQSFRTRQDDTQRFSFEATLEYRAGTWRMTEVR